MEKINIFRLFSITLPSKQHLSLIHLLFQSSFSYIFINWVFWTFHWGWVSQLQYLKFSSTHATSRQRISTHHSTFWYFPICSFLIFCSVELQNLKWTVNKQVMFPMCFSKCEIYLCVSLFFRKGLCLKVIIWAMTGVCKKSILKCYWDLSLWNLKSL